MANAALQQLYTALDFAYRMEWVSRNVASFRLVPRYEKRRSEEFLDGEGYAAVGKVLRAFKARLAPGRRGAPARQGGRRSLCKETEIIAEAGGSSRAVHDKLAFRKHLGETHFHHLAENAARVLRRGHRAAATEPEPPARPSTISCPPAGRGAS